MKDKDLLVIGRIAKVHGVHGEVRVKPYTESVDAMGAFQHLYLCQPDKPPRMVDVVQCKPHQSDVLIRFKHVPSREAAEALVGAELSIERSWLPPAGEDEYYRADLIGLAAEDPDGASLGVVKNIWPIADNDILVLDRDGREVLVPFRAEIVREVDLPGGRIVLQLVEGLLDL